MSQMPAWNPPDDYFGYQPIGDFILCTKNYCSPLWEESNFLKIKEDMDKLNDKFLPPEEGAVNQDGDNIPDSWVYEWSASHWAVKEIYYLMIRADAPKEILDKANEIYSSLRNEYPIYDEDDYWNRQSEAILEYWQGSSIKDRIEYCKEADVSIFAARSNDPLPEIYDTILDSRSFD